MNEKISKGSAVVIFFLILLAFGALLYTYYYTKTSATQLDTLTLDKVSIVMQTENEENHKVELQVSLEGFSRVLRDNDKSEFELIVADVLNRSDYDKIVGKDGTQYLKEQVKKELQRNYGEESITDVYVGSLLCDTELPPDDSGEEDRQEIIDAFKVRK